MVARQIALASCSKTLKILSSIYHPALSQHSSSHHLPLIFSPSTTHPLTIYHSSSYHLPLILLPSTPHPLTIYPSSSYHLPLILLPSTPHPLTIYHHHLSHVHKSSSMIIHSSTHPSIYASIHPSKPTCAQSCGLPPWPSWFRRCMCKCWVCCSFCGGGVDGGDGDEK